MTQQMDWICCPHVEYQEDGVTPWIPEHGQVFTLSPENSEPIQLLILCGHCRDLVVVNFLETLVKDAMKDFAKEAMPHAR